MTGSVSRSKPAKLVNRARELVVTAVLAGGLIGALLTFFGEATERRLVFDTLQRAAPRELTTDEVVVVLIDDASVERYGQWPWIRHDIAVLLENIAKARPAAIGIDVYFTTEDPMRPEAFASVYDRAELLDPGTESGILNLPNWDRRLERVLSDPDTPSVLARAAVKDGGRPAGEVTFDLVEGSPPPGTPVAPNVLTSIDAFDITAFSRAFVNGAPDEDGVVRRVPLALRAGESVGSGFAVELAKVKEGVEALRWDGQTVQLADKVIPSDENAALQFKMAYYDENDIVSAFRVLADAVEPEAFRDKVVIVGVGATGTYDIVATPLGSEVPGPIVQAQAVDAMLKGEWLSHPTSMKLLEIVAAALLFGLLLAAGLTFRNWLLVPAGVLALALPITSYLAYTQANLLFDPARALLVGLFAAIGLLLARYALTLAELVDKRIAVEVQARENENARDMQMSMIPSAASLASLDKRADIGAVLEPARSVGGDFYDAMEIGENRVLFLVGDVSGKGMPAALFMALSKTVSKSKLAAAGNGLDKAVMALNQELMEEGGEMDLTMLVGLIDCRNGAIELVNAGHEDPLVVHTDGRVETFKMVGGPRLCALDDFPYPVEHLTLAQGETLVVITDGATDAANTKAIQFGLNGVIEALEAQPQGSARDRAAQLAKQVRLFEGNADPADDLTIFALRYLGDRPN